jgi:hypothetical protein
MRPLDQHSDIAVMARIYYGWWIVGACLLAAMIGNALGLFGAGVYLRAITTSTGWATGTVSGAVTLFYVVSAILLIPVGSGIGRVGPRPFVAVGGLAAYRLLPTVTVRVYHGANRLFPEFASDPEPYPNRRSVLRRCDGGRHARAGSKADFQNDIAGLRTARLGGLVGTAYHPRPNLVKAMTAILVAEDDSASMLF